MSIFPFPGRQSPDGATRPSASRGLFTPYDALERDGATYFHGTSSLALEGISQFRALLSMDNIDSIPWFHRKHLSWWDRNTAISPSRHVPTINGTSAGVRLERLEQATRQKTTDTIAYYTKMSTQDAAHYPVLLGFDARTRLLPDHAGQSYSDGSIGIDRITGIYVARDKVDMTKAALANTPRLAGRIKALPQGHALKHDANKWVTVSRKKTSRIKEMDRLLEVT